MDMTEDFSHRMEEEESEVFQDASSLFSDNCYLEPNYPCMPKRIQMDSDYDCRRGMQEIIPGVYQGPYSTATRAKLNDMKAAGLTHVVCIRQLSERRFIRPNHPDHFKYLLIEISDNVPDYIISHFKIFCEFLNECLASGGKVLVHGNAGISRSIALVIAYIMSRYGKTFKQANKFVQLIRGCTQLTNGLISQLEAYEAIYRAHHLVPLPSPNVRTSLKRTLESEDDNEEPLYPFKHTTQ